MQKLENYSQYVNLGMNVMSSPFNSIKGEWKVILNADIPKIGTVRKRLGYKKILDTPDSSEVLSLIPYEIGNAGKMIMINASGNAYASDTLTVGSGSWGTAIAIGLSTTERWGWTVLNGYLFLGNGIVSQKTDGIAFTDVVGMPIFRYATTLFQRLYCSGVTASPSTLFWSETGDGTGWSEVAPADASSTDIEKDWKGNIRAIGFSNDRILIYKDRMMKRWDDEYMRTIMDSDGIEASYSLSDIEGMLLYLNHNSISIYDGDAPKEISFPIWSIINSIDFSDTNKNRICGEVFQKKYYLSVGDVKLDDGTIVTNAVIVYDFRYNIFSIYSLAHRMTAMSKILTTAGEEKLYMGDINGNVYEMFNGNDDDGEDIEMLLESQIIYPYGGGFTINPKLLTVVTEQANNMVVKIGTDYGQLKEIGSLQESVENILVNEIIGETNGFRLQFSHTANSRPALTGWSLDYLISGKRNG